MAIRNTKLGGTDWTEEGLKPTVDLNPTIDAVVELAAVGIAQNAYQTLQANNVFDNKDFLVTDEFTDSTGTNNTVNTTSSTATYDSTNLNYKLGFTDEASSDTTVDDSWTNPSNAFDNNDSSFASKQLEGTFNLGKTFTSKFVSFIKWKIRGSESGTGVGSGTIKIQTFDGTTWNDLLGASISITDESDTTLSGTTLFDGNCEGVRCNFFNTSGGTNTVTGYLYTLEYGNYDTSSIVIADTGTLTLIGTENSICVYADKTTPTNTTMTVDISDGTTTLSTKSLNTLIPLTGFSSGTLKLTFNLATTDTSVTPTITGYGVYIK